MDAVSKKHVMKIPGLILLLAAAAQASVIYSSIPSPLPPNVPSLGYEATSSAEFGGLIQFAGVDRLLTSATIVISEWAPESEYEAVGTSTGFDLPMTLKLYDVGPGNTVGALIGSAQVTATIQWRPEADPTCTSGVWRASNGTCYNGFAQTVTFTLPNLLVPDAVIYGLAFDTQHHGYQPTGIAGPVNSTNFGLSSASPSVGSNPLPGTAYWNTSYAGFYADGGAAGVGVFRQDTNWTPYSGAITFDASSPTPEPATTASLITGLVLLGLKARKRR